jgi:hypothetical protein
MYLIMLEEAYMERVEQAMQFYEGGIQVAANIGIAESPWIDRIKERIREINPESEALEIKLVAWKPAEKPKQYDEHGNEIIARRDPEFDRNMRRIKDIVSRDISVDDKISQLNRIRMEAERNILMEEERIKNLRAGS